MQEYAIIVAGGSGSRMKCDIPKQFLLIKHQPILMYTIKAFRAYSENLNIIVVLPEDQFEYWYQLCYEHSFTEKYSLIPGGETRFHSVKNGLESIDSQAGLVAVHDGVRPIISKEIIADSFEKAARYGTAVVSVPLKDSIRSVETATSNKAEDRTKFRLIQTPQTFRLDWMRAAFSQSYQEVFTDCASVLESAGHPIQMIDGAYENIKITTPEDLRWAEIYLNP
ncbi:2-C-methyl-D-erythritol 4-phosphate cytidylyltransferase [Dyadobacter pollutisoli]|jgi:2-C-methyl-D-erythritol 4-phosphate cytidylyltransferase|uniref:2-C-methyl-D-erythritol 4-phosphate cytidylyltransferase n=1 Tax=Dyadobacter pollutisoli TaxID=2910158 RepID=A0A9E8N5W2_9BACT|nr:2-C-methyl-D-erythritol 4-phosphate cytidylyltransferase [Dyadobacter pollutisoli]WAC10414.1 2-C-methyl-D-erythritol 4-phosphate cytidylyltransferase [Dyadobacter pollutisoli]